MWEKVYEVVENGTLTGNTPTHVGKGNESEIHQTQ